MPHETANEKWINEKGAKFRKYVEEDCPKRRQRIQSVVDEWNKPFFRPRMIHINARFVNPSLRSDPSFASDLNTTNINTLNVYGPATLQRPHSLSSVSSSSSSSFSSVDSIRSKDLEGAEISQLRSSLVAFRLDLTEGNSLQLKKEHKEQRKELKREVKDVVKEVKNARKADRKLRKAERKSRREGNRAEIRVADRISRAQEKARRKQEKAQRKAFRARSRGIEAPKRAIKQTVGCRGQVTGSHERAADAPSKRLGRESRP